MMHSDGIVQSLPTIAAAGGALSTTFGACTLAGCTVITKEIAR
jgi:hypothetical protein